MAEPIAAYITSPSPTIAFHTPCNGSTGASRTPSLRAKKPTIPRLEGRPARLPLDNRLLPLLGLRRCSSWTLNDSARHLTEESRPASPGEEEGKAVQDPITSLPARALRGEAGADEHTGPGRGHASLAREPLLCCARPRPGDGPAGTSPTQPASRRRAPHSSKPAAARRRLPQQPDSQAFKLPPPSSPPHRCLFVACGESAPPVTYCVCVRISCLSAACPTGRASTLVVRTHNVHRPPAFRPPATGPHDSASTHAFSHAKHAFQPQRSASRPARQCIDPAAPRPRQLRPDNPSAFHHACHAQPNSNRACMQPTGRRSAAPHTTEEGGAQGSHLLAPLHKSTVAHPPLTSRRTKETST